jgi:ribonuclease-3
MGLEFRSLDSLRSALTHRSIQGVSARPGEDMEIDNQRLEFLGDAVLDMLVAELLFPVRPRLSEGHMTRLRAWMVCEPRLAEVARSLDLGSHLIMAPSERTAGGCYKPSVLADALEAVVAAVFLDLGFEAARSLVARLWAPYLTREILMTGHNDFKTSLQEFTQSMRMGLPAYSLTGSTGEAHRQIFTAQVRLLEQIFEGRGTTRKEAEQEAAKLMLEHLKAAHAKA